MTRSKILLPRYDFKGASSRVRFYNYKRYFNEFDWFDFYFPFFSNRYLELRYSKNKIFIIYLFYSYLRRIFVLIYLILFYRKSELLIEKELFPGMPYWFERFFLMHFSYKLDYDDAIFHNYDLSEWIFLRLNKSKIVHLAKKADLTVVGNAYLNNWFTQREVKNICYIPSCVDKPDVPLNGTAKSSRFVWIGTPETVKYLSVIESVLMTLSTEIDFELVVVGADYNLPGVRVVCMDWYVGIESDVFSQVSFGIMPLFDSPWERGKCGYKLLQYLSFGLPVVASAVGVNNTIVIPLVNGLLASSEQDWFESLRYLLLLERTPSIDSSEIVQGTICNYLYTNWISNFKEVYL